jgi:hypothetical protein
MEVGEKEGKWKGKGSMPDESFSILVRAGLKGQI